MGLYLYNSDTNEEIAFEDKTENSIIIENMNNNLEEVKTSSSNTKITPNTEMVEEVYYAKCGHKKTNKIDNKDFVNMAEEELLKENKEWEIKEFSESKVIVSKQVEEFCNNHYLLKDIEGYINIYKLDENDNEMEMLEVTEIATKYLSEKDSKDLEEGIKVYSKQDLNKLIEDFE